jgi:nitrogen regulatory protein PII
MAEKKSDSLRAKLPFRVPFFHAEAKSAVQNKTAPLALKFCVVIVNWDKIQLISKLLQEKEVLFHFISKGTGTATSNILDILGVGAEDKGVVICLEPAAQAPELLQAIREELHAHGPGAGIAFAVSLSALNTVILRGFKKKNIRRNIKFLTSEGGNNMETTRSDLIISIINQGYSDEFMTVAREAGARGGTVLSARGLAGENAVKFLGVSMQEEKEIIIILTKRDKKEAIMQAVSRTHGIASKAEGVIFSLPVDSTLGLSS